MNDHPTLQGIVIRRECGRWAWCCHLCHPPARGSRNVWADIFRITLPRHFVVRQFHHAWARGRR